MFFLQKKFHCDIVYTIIIKTEANYAHTICVMLDVNTLLSDPTLVVWVLLLDSMVGGSGLVCCLKQTEAYIRSHYFNYFIFKYILIS